MRSSRTEKDKKCCSTSIRFTEEQLLKAKNSAKENNMTVSSYIGYLVDKESSSITPQAMIKLQDILNRAVDGASAEQKESMQKEADEFWQLLK